jgi:hypothetical protein
MEALQLLWMKRVRIYSIDELLLFHVADTVPEAIRILCSTNLSEFNKVLELD